MKSGAKTRQRDVYSEKQNKPVGYVYMEFNTIRLQNCSFASPKTQLTSYCAPLPSVEEEVGGTDGLMHRVPGNAPILPSER